MNRTNRDTLLGVVFFGTLGFLLWATVNLTDVAVTGVPPLKVYVADAGGLRIGDAVHVLGKRVGKVATIDADWTRPDNRILLTLRMEENVPLTVNKRIEVQGAGVLGGKQVFIDPGIGAEWPKDRELIGGSAPDVLKAASDFFGGEGAIGSELKAVLVELRKFTLSMNDPDTTVGALVKRRELYDEVLASAQSLRAIFQSIERGEGLFGRVIKDTNMRDDGIRILQNLANVSDRLASNDSTIGRLLNDKEMSQRLADIVGDIATIVNGVRSGRGLAGRLLEDEAMGKQFGDAIASLQSALHKIDDPNAGALGALLGDAELRDQLKAIAGNLASITAKIDTGKGALGLLIGDEEMGIRLRRIFTQVSRALEDAREAAPISNFVQVLFGVF
jgi:ABC-type transporter Mla subunit MlaD